MAEFLIYNKKHWMDDLTPQQIESFRLKYSGPGKEWLEKYNARYQEGDIVEIRPDGYWTGVKARGFDKEAFRVVAVPGLAVNEELMKPVVEERMTDPIKYGEDGLIITTTHIIKKRRFSFVPVDPGDVIIIQKSKFNPTDKSL